MSLKLAVVVATTQPEKTREFWSSWRKNSLVQWQAVVVWGGRDSSIWHSGNVAQLSALEGLMLPGDIVSAHQGWGTVPLYLHGIMVALRQGADVVACFHDDLRIDTVEWDQVVLDHFERRPKCLLAGFGGAKGLGHPDIYKIPYEPMQLARHDFRSNMRDAEAHGSRTTEPQRVACLDGFSLIGRTNFMREAFLRMHQVGMVHHAYDSLLGAYAARAGGEAWLLPIACHHAGGRTAVGDPRYEEWARKRHPEGDRRIWADAHAIAYEEARGILPLRVE